MKDSSQPVRRHEFYYGMKAPHQHLARRDNGDIRGIDEVELWQGIYIQSIISCMFER